MPKPGKPHAGKWVAYYRVSTDRQGESGLGLEAQRRAVADYLNGGSWTLAAEYTEVESGKRSDNRPQLTAALAACKRLKAKLIVAKLDRLSRNVGFICALLNSGVEFVAADMPHANKMTLQVLAVFAEHERDLISARTKQALAARRGQGARRAARRPEACRGLRARRRCEPGERGALRREHAPHHPRDPGERGHVAARSSARAYGARRAERQGHALVAGRGKQHHQAGGGGGRRHAPASSTSFPATCGKPLPARCGRGEQHQAVNREHAVNCEHC
jgi:DNA invertase Pin-like site-specific DNA recombinase